METSKLERCKLITEIVASIATIVALSIITWQVIIARQALQLQSISLDVQSWQSITQGMVEIDKTFIEHPNLYPYFYQKIPVHPNDEIYPKVVCMADMLLDFMDGFDDDYVRKLAGMDDNGRYWAAWENYFIDQFRLSPALCDRYKEVRSWYTENGIIGKFAAQGGCQPEQRK